MGDILCTSGQIGFCPVPHLHIQLYKTKSDQSKSIQFVFKHEIDKNQHHFIPKCGQFYNNIQFGMINN